MPQLQPGVSHWGALVVEDVYLQDLKVYIHGLQAAGNKKKKKITFMSSFMGWLPEELNTDLDIKFQYWIENDLEIRILQMT